MSSIKAGRPRVSDENKAKPKDKMKCKICNGTYLRSNKTHHNKTKIHKIYENMHLNLKQIIIDELTPIVINDISKRVIETC